MHGKMFISKLSPERDLKQFHTCVIGCLNCYLKKGFSFISKGKWG